MPVECLNCPKGKVHFANLYEFIVHLNQVHRSAPQQQLSTPSNSVNYVASQKEVVSTTETERFNNDVLVEKSIETTTSTANANQIAAAYKQRMEQILATQNRSPLSKDRLEKYGQFAASVKGGALTQSYRVAEKEINGEKEPELLLYDFSKGLKAKFEELAHYEQEVLSAKRTQEPKSTASKKRPSATPLKGKAQKSKKKMILLHLEATKTCSAKTIGFRFRFFQPSLILNQIRINELN